MGVDLALLLDEHLRPAIAATLRERGIDILHVQELGLKGASDSRVFRACAESGRTLVTRDVGDVMRLSEQLRTTAGSSPALLLVPAGIPDEAPGLLIDAIERWVTSMTSRDSGWQAGRAEWLLPSEAEGDGEEGMVREAPAPYARALERVGA